MAQSPKTQKPHKTKRVAMGGVLAALSLALLLVAGISPIGTFAGPIFASLCLIPLLCEFGPKTALLSFLAVSLLAFFLVPDKETVLIFFFLTGYYPVIRPKINTLRYAFLRVGAKLLLFTLALFLCYTLLLLLFASPAMLAQLTGYSLPFAALLAVGGCATFFLYDILLDKVTVLYHCRFRNIFFK